MAAANHLFHQLMTPATRQFLEVSGALPRIFSAPPSSDATKQATKNTRPPNARRSSSTNVVTHRLTKTAPKPQVKSQRSSACSVSDFTDDLQKLQLEGLALLHPRSRDNLTDSVHLASTLCSFACTEGTANLLILGWDFSTRRFKYVVSRYYKRALRSYFRTWNTRSDCAGPL